MDNAELIATLRKKAAEYRQSGERLQAESERLQVNAHGNVGAAQACETFIQELTENLAADGKLKPDECKG